MLSMFAAGCSEGAPTDPGHEIGGHDDDGGPELVVDCSLTPEDLMVQLESHLPESIPSRDQLDCYSSDVTRAPRPAFWVNVGHQPFEVADDPSTPDDDWQGTWPLVQEYVDILEAWPEATVMSYPLNEVPPYVTIEGDPFYPYTDETWDQKMRAAETLGLYLKSLGLPLTVHYFYPPNLDEWENSPIPATASSDEFLDWWRTHYIPERVSLAQLAERLQARYLQPWDVETGIMIRSHGDQWLDDLSEAERIEVAQTAMDELYAAVRPHFSGTLQVIVYDRYAAVGEYWQEMDHSAWDEVQFQLFGEGNVEGLGRYLDEQLAGYMNMVQRDGITNYTLAFIYDPEFNEHHLDEGETHEEIEHDLYETLFDRVADLPVPPVGIGITTATIQTDAARALVREKLAEFAQAAASTTS